MGLFSRAYRIETVWEGLRLVVEEHPDGGDWQLFVYDEEKLRSALRGEAHVL
jgi:hypothetical protein